MVARRLLPLLAACALLPALSSSVTADWGLNWGEMEWGLDSDGDGLSDIHEAELGTNPNDPDTDGDNVSDGTGTGGGGLTPGPDNCPFVANPDQANGDAFPAGDDCQCGNANGIGGIDTADLAAARAQLVERSDVGPFVFGLCDLDDDGLCTVEDLFLLDRIIAGEASPGNTCPGYGAP